MSDVKAAEKINGFSNVADDDIIKDESTYGAHHYGRVGLVVRKTEGIKGMPTMPTNSKNRPSPRLVLYGLAFRVLRRVALGADQRAGTVPALPARRASASLELEGAQSGGAPGQER